MIYVYIHNNTYNPQTFYLMVFLMYIFLLVVIIQEVYLLYTLPKILLVFNKNTLHKNLILLLILDFYSPHQIINIKDTPHSPLRK